MLVVAAARLRARGGGTNAAGSPNAQLGALMSGFPLFFRTRGSFPVRCFPWKGGSGEKPPRWCSASRCPAPRRCVSQHCTSRWCTSWHCASRCCSSQCSTDEGCNTLVVQTPRWGYKSQQCRVLVLCAPVLCVLALSFLAWCFLVLCVLVLCIPVLCVLVLRVPVLCALVLRVLVLCVPVLCVPASLLPGFPILLLQVPASSRGFPLTHPGRSVSWHRVLTSRILMRVPAPQGSSPWDSAATSLSFGERKCLFGAQTSALSCCFFFFVGESCLKAPRAENPTVDFNRAWRRACRHHWMQAVPVPGHLAPMPKAPG